MGMKILNFLRSVGAYIHEFGTIIRIGMTGVMVVGAPAVVISEHSAGPLLLIPGAFIIGAALEWIGSVLEEL